MKMMPHACPRHLVDRLASIPPYSSGHHHLHASKSCYTMTSKKSSSSSPSHVATSTSRNHHRTHMFALFCSTLLFLCLLQTKFIIVQAAITEQCLGCICHASSGCDSTLKCHNDGNGGYFCGPYQISWGYWSDAGRMGSRGGDHDFETCLNNKICAEATIVSYMNKYASDCNQDGSIDCNDFAAIHKAGPKSCNADWLMTSVYWKKFQSTPCYRRPNPNRSSRDFFLDEILPPSRGRINGFTPVNEEANRRPNQPPVGRIDAPPFQLPPPQAPPDRFRSRGGNQPFVNNRSPTSRVSWAFNHTQPDPLGFRIIGEPDNGSFFPPQPPVPPTNRFHVPVNDRRLPSPASFRPNVNENGRRFEEPQPVPPVSNNNRFENFNSRPLTPPNFRSNFQPPAHPSPVNNNNFRPPVYNNNAPINGNLNPRLLNDGPPPPNFNVSRPVPPVDGPPPVNNRQPVPFSPEPRANIPFANNRAVNAAGIVPPACLSCLCAASSGCDWKRGCVGDFCGPYLISWNYWSDAGRPGKDFISCALNRYCAEDTIQGYMTKWTRDCNGDGIVDCDDFAAIHKLGPHMCRSEAITSTSYWREYEKCDARSRPSSSSHVGSSSVAVGDLRRPERGFNDIPLLPDHERRRDGGPPLPPPSPFAHNSENNGFRNHASNLPNNAGFLFPAPFFFDGGSSVGTATTTRPPLDLPLITPRRRLYAPSSSSSSPVTPAPVREGRSNNNDAVTSNNVIDNSGKPVPQDLSKECMECICDASSGCNEQGTACPLDDASSHHLPKTCGPYQFDRNYWTLSGRAGRSFESCANEKGCAEETVGRFIHQMSFDCNEDGVIDCLDYASIHRVGPKSCNSQWFLESPYWSTFEQCYGFGRRRR